MIESFKLPTITPETISGAICSFNDEYGGLPLKSCVSQISGYQEGTGTPSPDNVRPLHAFSSANIGQTSGYGEYFRGLLNGTYGFVDLGSLTWTLLDSYSHKIFRAIIDTKLSGVTDNINILSDNFTELPCIGSSASALSDFGNGNNPYCMVERSGYKNIYVQDDDYNSATSFKTAMQNHYLIYKMASQTTPITPQDFATLCQAFGITGNTYTFTFGQNIYQGEIDWLKGVVTSESKIANLSDYTWEYIDSQTSGYDYGYFRISGNIEDMKSIVGLECEIFKNEVSSRTDLDDNEIGRYNSSSFNRRLCVRCDSCTTINDFNNLISNKKLAYELATPITIPLGGIILLTQEGQNNIFADCGDTEVTHLKVT